MTEDELLSKIKHGRFFSIVFVKRTTNEIRHMVCRTGVKSYLHGGKLPYNPKEKNLMPVFDIHKLEYRMLNLDHILTIKAEGHTYDYSSPNLKEFQNGRRIS